MILSIKDPLDHKNQTTYIRYKSIYIKNVMSLSFKVLPYRFFLTNVVSTLEKSIK